MTARPPQDPARRARDPRARQALGRHLAAASGAVAALVPSPLVLAAWSGGADGPAWWSVIVGVLATLALAVAAGRIHEVPAYARRVVAGAAAATAVLAAPVLVAQPAVALLTAVVLALALGALGRAAKDGSERAARDLGRADRAGSRARGACAAAGTVALAVLLGGAPAQASAVPLIGAGVGLLVAVVEVVVWARAAGRGYAWLAAGGVVLAAVVAAPLVTRGVEALAVGLVAPVVGLVAVPRGRRTVLAGGGPLDPILGHPERVFVAGFLLLCLVGAVVLALPASSADGAGVGLGDAAFTSVSAVCVTGLVVLDTPVDFSAFGHVVILALIQLGGLGIMTFSTAALRLLGRRMSLRHEGVAARIVSDRDRGALFAATRRLVVFTLVVELVGAALLTVAFVARGEPFGAALWRAVFTSVSAFCNAGFALQSDSLVPYAEDAAVLHVVAVLIVLGGLSPAVALAIPSLVRRSPRPAPLQARLALALTAGLLVAGFVLYLGLEWDGSLAHLSAGDRIHNAWFQSVTLRTAGFNTVDLAAAEPATVTVMMALMLVGGSPGGTAGGLKTTTVAVLGLAVLAAVRGRSHATAFGRRIPHATVYKAAAITVVALLVAGAALIGLEVTQDLGSKEAAFESVSAVATVGLSVGATGALDGVGKAIIMACMFLGRVGMLTLFVFLMRRGRGDDPLWEYPEEPVDVA